jgi:hypothetical protein
VKDLKATPVSGVEHGLKLRAFAGFAAALVDIGGGDFPALLLAVFLQLGDLVKRVLAAVLGADTGVNGAFHEVSSKVRSCDLARRCRATV